MIYKYKHPEHFRDVPNVVCKDHNSNLVIFGAGVNGAIAARLLEKQGVRFSCFVDSDKRKWGTEYLGYMVISPAQMKKKHPDATVMVTPYQVKAAYEQVRNMGYKNIITPHFLFLNFDMDSEILDILPDYSGKSQLIYAINRYLSKLSEFYVNEPLLVRGRGLNLMITERCTLRCKECLNRIPYYKNPIHYDWSKMKKALERLSKVTTFQNILVQGGEVFLHPNLPEILEFLIEMPQFESITAITNSTLLPSKQVLEVLRHNKITVRLSDYGKNSCKIHDLQTLFERKKIKYIVICLKWFKCNEIHLYDRTPEEVQDVYANCCKSDSDLPHLADGRLYKCQFADSAERLSVIPAMPADSVDLLDESIDEDDLLRKVDQLYKRENFIDACRYCSGRGYFSEVIPAAEQIKGSLPEIPKLYEREVGVYER